MLRSTLPLFARAFFVLNIVLGSVAFRLFLDWYDTGRIMTDGLYAAGITGILVGCLALVFEVWACRAFTLRFQNLFLFFTRLIVLSVLYIDASFALGLFFTGLAYGLGEGGGSSPMPQALLIFPLLLFIMLFYLLMIIPFGIVVGLANGLVVRLTNAFEARKP